MSELAVLKQVPLFSGMADEEIAALRSIMDSDAYAPGEVIIHEGEQGDDFYIVVEGRVQFSIQTADGGELVVDEVGPGGFFGELSMLTGEPRSARVQALEAVTTLALDRTCFMTYLEHHPQTAIGVLTVLGRRLHRTDKMLRQSVSRNVNVLAEERLTLGQRIAETIANYGGSVPFLMIHLAWFIAWVVWNQPWFPAPHFDMAPHDILALVVGLEATLLSIFVLISQNRQEAKDRLAMEIDHQVNTKAEIEIGLILRRLDDMERMLHHYYAEQCALTREMHEEHAGAELAALRGDVAHLLQRLNEMEKSLDKSLAENVNGRRVPRLARGHGKSRKSH